MLVFVEGAKPEKTEKHVTRQRTSNKLNPDHFDGKQATAPYVQVLSPLQAHHCVIPVPPINILMTAPPTNIVIC